MIKTIKAKEGLKLGDSYINNDLREQAKRIGNPAYRDNESTCYTCDELDELITLIRNATLDEVRGAVIDAKIDRDSTPIHNTLKAIDNLRGKIDGND